MTKKARSGSRRKSHRRAVKEYCSYIVEIQDWELTYSLGLNPNPKLLSGQYTEALHLSLKGILRQPEKYSSKEITSTFIGDREIFPTKNDSDFTPRCVGAITLRGEQRDFIGALPFDSLPIISSPMQSNQVQFVDFYGQTHKYGHADIRWIHFFKKYDPEEY